jgi:hypothetical protein
MEKIKGLYSKVITVALSGGLLGILLYFIIVQAGDKKILFSNINYFLFSLLIIPGCVFYTFLYIFISFYSARLYRTDILNELKINFYIFILPLTLIFILPLYFIFYEKLFLINFKMVGFLYIPFYKFIHFLFPGYFLIMLSGFYLITICSLLLFRFLKYEFNTGSGFEGKKIKTYFFALFLFYFITTTYITIIYPPTGDEPHFLLITKSLLKDRDFNLENDYVNEKSYKEFYPDFLEYENIHNTKDKNNLGIYSIHPPGLSFLIAIPYLLGKRIGVQIFLNLITTLLIILIFKYLLENGISKKIAFFCSFWFALSVPILINSSLVLTEITSALLIVYSLIKLNKIDYDKNHFLFFLCLSYLPWLHSKLAVFSIIFYFYYYYELWVIKKFNFKKEIINNSFVFFSLILFLFYYYSIYGKFAVFALTSIFQSTSFYFIFSIGNFIKNFFAVLFDRDYGLFIYNPLFIVFLWGIILSFKKDKKNLLPLIFIMPYLILFLFWKDWSGSMTPARQLIPVLPVFVFYISFFLENTQFIKTKLFKMLFIISIFWAYIFMIVPAIRYLSGKEKIYPIFIKTKVKFLLWFLPSFYDKINFNHYLTFFYLIIIILLYFKYKPGKKVYE